MDKLLHRGGAASPAPTAGDRGETLGDVRVWVAMSLLVGLLLRGLVWLLGWMGGGAGGGIGGGAIRRGEVGGRGEGGGSLNYDALVRLVESLTGGSLGTQVFQAVMWLAAVGAVCLVVGGIVRRSSRSGRGNTRAVWLTVTAAGVLAVHPAGVSATSALSPEAVGAAMALFAAATALWVTRNQARLRRIVGWGCLLLVLVAAVPRDGGGMWASFASLPGRVTRGSVEAVTHVRADVLIRAVGLSPGPVDWHRRLVMWDWGVLAGEDRGVLWVGVVWLGANAAVLAAAVAGVVRLAWGRRWGLLWGIGGAWVAAVLIGGTLQVGHVTVAGLSGWRLVALAVLAFAGGTLWLPRPERPAADSSQSRRRRRKRAWEVDEEAGERRAGMTFSPLAGLPPED